jgi:hypothetical protein
MDLNGYILRGMEVDSCPVAGFVSGVEPSDNTTRELVTNC